MGVIRWGEGSGAPRPPDGPPAKNLHGKMLRVAARYHNIVVFRTRQRWQNANDTIALTETKHSTARRHIMTTRRRKTKFGPLPMKNYKYAHAVYGSVVL